MVYSTDRKLTLSAWLKKHREAEYKVPLKLQKFLFLVLSSKLCMRFFLGYFREPFSVSNIEVA